MLFSSAAALGIPEAGELKVAALGRAEESFMEQDDLKAELERLRAENERLRRPRSSEVSLRISEKGGVSAYGLGRFPVTLYKEQWLKLLAAADDIRAYIAENEERLKSKEPR